MLGSGEGLLTRVGVDLVPPIPLLGKFVLWSHFNSFFFLNWIAASRLDLGAGSLSNLQFPSPLQCTHATGALCAASCWEHREASGSSRAMVL